MVYLFVLLACLPSLLLGLSMIQLTPVERIRALQKASNGFDLRGVTVRTDGTETAPVLDQEAAFWAGYGFAKSLLTKQAGLTANGVKIGIGRDPRTSGAILSNWFAGGVRAAGGDAYCIGLCTTPAMYYCCQKEITDLKLVESAPWPFDAGVCVTASHLPKQWNGFKLFTSATPSNIGSEGIDEVCKALENVDSRIVPIPLEEIVPAPSFLPVYSAFLQKTVKQLFDEEIAPLANMKVCVNAGNGAGGFLASCLADLGADTTCSIYIDPDGSFPNHIANPEDREAIEATAKAVLDTGADIGICLDTDADRVGIVDKNGRLLNRNGLVALVSKIALASSSTMEVDDDVSVVTDSSTSNGVSSFIEQNLGGKHIRYKKGYRYVIELARSTPDCAVAVECSGHGAWKDNGWVDDGCYSAVRIIAALAKYRKMNGNASAILSDLINDLREPAESVEIRCRMMLSNDQDNSKNYYDRISDVASKAVGSLRELAEKTNNWKVDPINYEGLRVSVQHNNNSERTIENTGWCMLRPSLHEPILSIQMESDVENGVKEIATLLLQQLKNDGKQQPQECDALDLKPLEDYVNKK